MKIFTCLLCIPLILGVSRGYSQTNTPDEASELHPERSSFLGNTKALITGSAWFGASYNDKEDVKLNFNTYGFTPVFIWKLSDKMFLESELEIADGEIELEYAKLSYSINKYMTIGAGRMLTPFGAYGERWEPAFVERFPNSPLLPDDQYLPDDTHLYYGAIMGIDISGDVPLGSSRLNYNLFVSNGPSLARSEETGELLGGVIQYENLNDNNTNKGIGGRIGLIPFANSSLEVGISGNTGLAGDENDPDYKDVRANALAVDLSYVKQLSGINSIIGLKAQFSSLTVDQADYIRSDTSYTYDNNLQSFFAQLSFRPATVNSSCLKNFEILYRYNVLTPPEDAEWGGKPITRNDFGLCYWLSWRTGVRLAYETTTQDGAETKNEFLVRYVMGF